MTEGNAELNSQGVLLIPNFFK